MWWTLLVACFIPTPLSFPSPCDSREVWWRDADGDGVGDGDVMYLGCTPPPGYVSTVDTGPDDTGPADTGPDDTGPDDTGAPPS